MNELERRLREGLRARAEDVEPTAELWLEVQERRERKRRLRWVGAVATAAAAVVVAVVAVPFAIDALQQEGTGVILGEPPATAPPTEPATPTGSPATGGETPLAGRSFATDGTGLYELAPDGTVGERIWRFPREGGSGIVAFDIRPAVESQDPRTIILAMLTEAEGTYDLRWATIRYPDAGGPSVDVEVFPDPYNVINHQVGGSVPAPVWSPDGSHLAFVEDGDEGEPGLRVIGWSQDGPGTDRTADDNASYGYPIFPRGVDARLQEWVWDTQGPGAERSGRILATAVGGGGHALEVQRQGDGAVPYIRTVDIPADGALFDVAEPLAGELFQLTAQGSGESVIDLTLTRTSPDGDEELPLPAELDELRSSDPSGIWMNAAAGGVLVGDRDRVWLVTMDRAGEWGTTAVEAGLTYADGSG
ncbi:MAG: hypothetical protein KY437_01660 [Actinobacteria bacterium]|nr:hypothetical protein [Actinomycetota bacterium]